jgi:hypothetical protein
MERRRRQTCRHERREHTSARTAASIQQPCRVARTQYYLCFPANDKTHSHEARAMAWRIFSFGDCNWLGP